MNLNMYGPLTASHLSRYFDSPYELQALLFEMEPYT